MFRISLVRSCLLEISLVRQKFSKFTHFYALYLKSFVCSNTAIKSKYVAELGEGNEAMLVFAVSCRPIFHLNSVNVR